MNLIFVAAKTMPLPNNICFDFLKRFCTLLTATRYIKYENKILLQIKYHFLFFFTEAHVQFKVDLLEKDKN